MEEINNMQDKRAETGKSSVMLLVVGWIAAVLSLVIYPFIFGLVGVVSGILASKGGSRAGISLIIASIVFMGIGLIYSAIILANIRRVFGF